MKLDFETNEVIWDDIKVPMRNFNDLQHGEELCNLVLQTAEPLLIREAEARVQQLADSKYEKADLTKFVHEHCTHLE